MKTIEIPELALVAFVGASGSGKSTLARKHFLPLKSSRLTSSAGSSATMRTIRPARTMHSTRCTT
jgi:predicted kinase